MLKTASHKADSTEIMAPAKALQTYVLNDGHSIPWLAFGSGTAFWKQDARQATLTAINAGFRHIDTAQMYGNEDTVGNAIVESGVPRSEFFITTLQSHDTP